MARTFGHRLRSSQNRRADGSSVHSLTSFANGTDSASAILAAADRPGAGVPSQGVVHVLAQASRAQRILEAVSERVEDV